MSRHAHHDDVIGTAPTRNALAGLPMFTDLVAPVVTPADAEAEIRRDFLGVDTSPAPAPAPRAREETAAFEPAEPLTELERQRRREQIKAAVREPLADLARRRRDASDHDTVGVTAQDARRIADQKHLTHLLGTQQRSWSWLSEWLQSLAREGALTKWRFHGIVMKRMADNGNDQVIYLDPYDQRARDVA